VSKFPSLDDADIDRNNGSPPLVEAPEPRLIFQPRRETATEAALAMAMNRLDKVERRLERIDPQPPGGPTGPKNTRFMD
jgi:hypothetical protein